jgi:hypothetical protein
MKFRNLFFVIVAIVPFLGLFGCANVPVAPIENDKDAKSFRSPKVGMSNLYLVRNTLFGQTSVLELSINGLPVAKTAPRTYVKFELPPGRYYIGSRGENYDQKVFDLVEGVTYFVWQRVWTGWNDFRTELIQLPQSDGRAAVLESTFTIKLIDDKDIAPIRAK